MPAPLAAYLQATPHLAGCAGQWQQLNLAGHDIIDFYLHWRPPGRKHTPECPISPKEVSIGARLQTAGQQISSPAISLHTFYFQLPFGKECQTL